MDAGSIISVSGKGEVIPVSTRKKGREASAPTIFRVYFVIIAKIRRNVNFFPARIEMRVALSCTSSSREQLRALGNIHFSRPQYRIDINTDNFNIAGPSLGVFYKFYTGTHRRFGSLQGKKG